MASEFARPRHLRVNSKRNSDCGSARLESLDFATWWTDTSFGQLYLHVPSKDRETVHRVYCRYADKPRLSMRAGALCWLVTANQEDVTDAR